MEHQLHSIQIGYLPKAIKDNLPSVMKYNIKEKECDYRNIPPE